MKYTFVTNAGTTRLRISLFDENRNRIGHYVSNDGVRHTAEDGDNHRLLAGLKKGFQTLQKEAGIRKEDDLSCIAYGMITSNAGLLEIPHLLLPATERDLQEGMVEKSFPELLPCPITFIPGLKTDPDKTGTSYPDMMRGEETETIGLYSLLKPDSDAVFVLPGSHNKLIYVHRDGCIQGLKTCLSGELLDALTMHTILADTLEKRFLSEEEYSRELFFAGVSVALKEGLSHAAFTARSMRVLSGKSAIEARNYLLGVVLSQDLIALQSFSYASSGLAIYIAGKAPLSTALCDLFRENGFRAETVPNEITESMGSSGALKLFFGA